LGEIVPHHIVNWGEPNWAPTSQSHLLFLSVSRLRVLGLWEHGHGSDTLISRGYSKQIPLFPQLGRLQRTKRVGHRQHLSTSPLGLQGICMRVHVNDL